MLFSVVLGYLQYVNAFFHRAAGLVNHIEPEYIHFSLVTHPMDGNIDLCLQGLPAAINRYFHWFDCRLSSC